MKDEMQFIRLELFHTLGKSIAIGGDIFLDDNLDDDKTLNSYTSQKQDINRFPYKLLFTAAVVVIQGQMNSVINGIQYSVLSGDVLIVQHGSVVESMYCSSNLKIIAMAFTDRYDIEYSQPSTAEISSFIQHRVLPVTAHFEEEELYTYITLYKAVKKIFQFTDVRFRDDVVKGFLQISTSSFYGHIKEENLFGGTVRSRANEMYLGFLDDLQKFCTKERSVEFYANRCCVCATYFTRQIKAVSGKSPSQIIRDRVLVEAKAMLNSTDMSVHQISEALHFSNDSFFCRWFKEASGRTPTEFRQGKD